MHFFSNSHFGRGHHRCARGGHLDIRPDFPFGGGGGRRERIFASGDLKFVVLHLLGQKPAHGYEIIKAMGDLVGGDYTPSPGTIYPTLTMLEDLGWITSAQQEGGRKEYRISAEGQARLDEQRETVERILAHLGHVRKPGARPAPAGNHARHGKPEDGLAPAPGRTTLPIRPWRAGSRRSSTAPPSRSNAAEAEGEAMKQHRYRITVEPLASAGRRAALPAALLRSRVARRNPGAGAGAPASAPASPATTPRHSPSG